MEKEQQEVNVLTSGKFTWTINNFSSQLWFKFFYSDTFFVGPYSWQIAILPGMPNIYLRGLLVDRLYAGDIDNVPVGSRSLNFKLSLVDQLHGKSTIINERENINIHQLKTGVDVVSFRVHSDLVFDRKNGFLVNDTGIVVAEVSVNDLGLDHDQNHPCLVMKSTALFMDFRGLCKIENDYVQLLENSCSKYPSLIESHRKRKRSQRFNQLSFTTLGKLLHFLKTKKVKDMKSDDACKELQDLWEEAEIRFDDLSWLEPHVKSALTYFENAAKVKKLKANVVDLEEKAKTLKAEVIAIDAVLETTKKELAKAEEGFVARDLDDQLGYGIIP
ncbi:MATH domain and coiled-coil domain-containing protein At3g44800-like [Arachis duranensis]|uniref:MATH domain and coiled-coil domain-containing protein At3g44800-like n=1 Tax=Arachis duranensis TaxID=130453 RepID=A0A9C6WK72_ARADU|nr:MATH domain and coiled-coil domain-containing protein At3g44800-like [Arachis duranensis]